MEHSPVGASSVVALPRLLDRNLQRTRGRLNRYRKCLVHRSTCSRLASHARCPVCRPVEEVEAGGLARTFHRNVGNEPAGNRKRVGRAASRRPLCRDEGRCRRSEQQNTRRQHGFSRRASQSRRVTKLREPRLPTKLFLLEKTQPSGTIYSAAS